MSLKLAIRSVMEIDVIQKCNTCLYNMNCSYRITSSKFILNCESFEDAAAFETKKKNLMELPKGLCSNCSKVKRCQLPKSATGVWHCEEYE